MNLSTRSFSLSLEGVVTSDDDGRVFGITCADAPPHLRILFLTARQMGGATIGDRVRLHYDVQGASAFWTVKEVLK